MSALQYIAIVSARRTGALGKFYLRDVTFVVTEKWGRDLHMAAIEQNAREGYETYYVRSITALHSTD